MGSLIILAVTFALLWLLFIRPQQRRVREHHALVSTVQEGDDVVLSAGIYGRIIELGPEEMTLEVAPGVELRVARQAILRRIEDARGPEDALPPAGDDQPGVNGPDSPDTPGGPGSGSMS
jgi:preprotein translocase subunit YajC